MQYREVINRLQNLIGYKPKQSELCEITGVKQSTMSQRSKDNSDFKNEEIEKLSKFYGVNLFTNKSENNQDCINISVRGDVEASMGYGVAVYNESKTATYAISRQLAKDLGINISESQIIFGRGNSMEPTIQGGDALLVDLSRKEINDGRIYCIRHDGELKAKRLQKLSKAKVKIISDNKDYDPIIIDFAQDLSIDFEVIGEIRWCGRIFL